MTEEYGHIPDGFLLNPEEIQELRKSKKELTEYGKKKLQELKHKEALEIARQGMVEYKDALDEWKDK
jgi:hypothetical protein